MHIVFRVDGKAQPAGSKRGFVIHKKGSQPRAIVVDANKKSPLWKEEVKQAALRAIPQRDWQLLRGPLFLQIEVYRSRPDGHYKRDGRSLTKKGHESLYPTSKPDTTKLVRGIEDALTKIIWHDDAQVVRQVASKNWGDTDHVIVTVSELEGD